MTDQIVPIGPRAAGIGGIADARPSSRIDGAAEGGMDFGEALANAMKGASGAENTAEEMSARFSDGDPNVGIHEVMIASEKASITMRYAVTLKNKMVSAYQELMNTQV